MATITAQDGTAASTTPRVVVGFEGESASGNVISELLNGELAVTLVGDLPRTGTLRLLFDDDIEAEAARALLARPCWFLFDAPERPALTFAFVRAGKIGTALHDEVRAVWEFEVGYQEVHP